MIQDCLKKIFLSVFTVLQFSFLAAQEITKEGAGTLKLGMSFQQFKVIYPKSSIKRESGEEGIIRLIASIQNAKGQITAKVYFDDSNKIDGITFLGDNYRIKGVPIGGSFGELKNKGHITSIFYTIDGDEAGVSVMIDKSYYPHISIRETKSLKLQLSKLIGLANNSGEIPINKMPLNAKIESVWIATPN